MAIIHFYFHFRSCWSNENSQEMTEILVLKNALGELTKEFQQMKYNCECKLQIWYLKVINAYRTEAE